MSNVHVHKIFEINFYKIEKCFRTKLSQVDQVNILVTKVFSFSFFQFIIGPCVLSPPHTADFCLGKTKSFVFTDSTHDRFSSLKHRQEIVGGKLQENIFLRLKISRFLPLNMSSKDFCLLDANTADCCLCLSKTVFGV